MKILYLILCILVLNVIGCSSECNEDCKQNNLDCDCCPQKDTSNFLKDTAKLEGVNVFIETSGSMSGLMPNKNSSQTEFQTILPDIFLRFRDEIRNTSLYSIYDSKSEFKLLDIDSTRINLIPKGKFSWGGSTYIPTMIDSVINYVSDKSVNILISDCIYTPESKHSGLTTQTISEIREKFNRISKKYSTIVYCIKSDFYYSNEKNIQSPFYLIVIGKDTNLSKVRKLLIQSFKTYNLNFFEINFRNRYELPYYSILPYSYNSGNYIGKSCKDFENAYLVIREIDFDHDSTLNFITGMNLELYPKFVNANDNLKKNIEIKINGNDFKSFMIEDKDLLKTGIKTDDKLIYDKCSSFLKLEIQSLEKDLNKAEISLKYSRPDWIKELNSDDQKTAETNREKTFGLEMIITGVEEAYNITGNSYFFKNLPIVLINK